ncbi:MAG TPA: CDP-alcohol phosphatidyltransferase, partial [bacterium]|nr:CDP-alcohol phosphatidyltransferase [bacterium]
DGISFCLAPAVMFYLVLSDLYPERSTVLAAVATAYCLAGIARLIYFTLDKAPIPGFFKGMPVPAAALLVMAPVEMTFQFLRGEAGWDAALLGLAVGTMLLAMVLMNLYPVHYLHVGRLMSRRPGFLWFTVVVWLVLVFTPYFGLALLAACLVYGVSPVFTGRIDPRHAAMESPAGRAP